MPGTPGSTGARPRCGWRAWGLLALLGGLAAVASADQQDPLYATLGANLSEDSNLYRLHPGASASALGITGGTTDLIRTLQVAVTAQKAWSLQHVALNASEALNHYQNHAYLDSSNLNYSGVWDWQVTPRLSGALTVSQSQTAASFGDYRNYATQNLITSQGRALEADWQLAGPWHAQAHLSESRVSNSTRYVQQASYQQYGYDAGARFVSAADNWLRLLLRQSHGGYTDRMPDPVQLLDSTFEQGELELAGHWALSGKSSLDGSLTWLRRRYAHFSQRNFDGSSGNLEYDWNASGHALIKLIATRATHDFEDSVFPFYTSSYVVENTLAIAPTLALGERESLTLRYQWGERLFEGPVSVDLVKRRDTPVSLLAQLDWTPSRTAQLSAALRRDTRGSTIPGYNFSDNTLNLSGQWTF